MRFDELDFEPALLDAIDAMNFQDCTPIQEQAIPYLLEGRDLIGVAQTGTGKTAAYLLPVLDKLSTGRYPEGAVNCLIMVPTRELAQQIDQQVEGFSYFTNVSSTAVYGGNDGIRFEQEKRGFAMGTDIVVATPGRLISHISLGNIDLSKVSFFILDEADRMLDMGFFDDIMQIVRQLPAKRQNMLFSATMPQEIQSMAKTILHNPAEVKIAVSRPADKILQAAYVCYEAQKLRIIQSLFQEQSPKRVIVFSSAKLKVKEITKSLRRMNMSVGEMHSDLSQEERDDIMLKFRNGHINMLVATDIVSRGIDIDDIDLVINYDVPHDPEDYVHRIGRTARAGAEGCALTFVSQDEQTQFGKIEKFLGKPVFKVPVPAELGEAPEYQPAKARPQGHGKPHGHKSNGPRKGNGSRRQNQ
ncbi:MAG: DEAD/DEAH box helicase [Bacteroidaceae bacterium]|nr:DEAD/DEAH box helicase [Bacteroidaceae bacterium]